jgi:nucleotide-binding universal stress UspA family protein
MVPLDGSEKDARALAVASALANLSDSDVHLVAVIEVPSERLIAQAEFVGVDEAAVTGRRDAEARLADIAARISVEAGRMTTFAVLEGNVADELIRQIVRCDARVVVMATRAPRAAERSPAGSIAERVTRESARPVVLVPPGVSFDRELVARFTCILLPLDGSELALRSVDFLLALPRAPELELVLVEVVSDSSDCVEARNRLDGTARRFRASGWRAVDVIVVEANEKADAIVATARERGADLIAMSTRGLSGLRHLMLGSVAEGVVQRSDVPVLLLTPTVLRHAAPIPEVAAMPHDSGDSMR